MEDLKRLDEVLEIEKDRDLSPTRLISIDRTLQGSIQVLGCQAIHDGQHFVICTKSHIHLFHKSGLQRSYTLPGRCYGYLYIESSTNSVPLHATFIDGGISQFYQIYGLSIKLSKSFQIPSDVVRCRRTFMVAARSKAVYVSFDSQNIMSFNGEGKLQVIYTIKMGELRNFSFIGNGTFLFCLYRHKSTGHFNVEIAKRSRPKCQEDSSDYTENGRRCFQTEKYVISSRYSLRVSDPAKCLCKKLNERFVVCITSRHTYVFESGSPPLTLENNTKLDVVDVVGVDGTVIDEKPRGLVLAEIFLFNSSGDMFSSEIELRSKDIQSVFWNRTYLLTNQSFEQGELSFVARLLTKSSRFYLTVSNLLGISVLDQKTCSSTVVLPGQSKNVFDGNCISTNGSDLESTLFCGAYTESHGFIERQTLIYSEDIFKLISKKQLLHQPVNSLWDTDCGLLYDSGDHLYSTDTDQRLASFDRGLWLTRNGIKIDDSGEEIVSVSRVAGSPEETSYQISVISVNGDLKIIDFREKEKSEVLLSLNLGLSSIQNSKSAVLYNVNDNCYYIACYHTHGYLKFFCDSVPVKVLAMRLDCFLSNLLLKAVGGSLYVILTTIDGRVKILDWETGDSILEISNHLEFKYEILDLGEESPFVLFYNESICILADLKEMVYGRLDIGLRPLQIIAASNKSNDLFYILDDEFHLNTVRLLAYKGFHHTATTAVSKGDLYDLPNSIPLRLMPFSNSQLAALVLRRQKKGNLSVILFDYERMCVVDDHGLTTKHSRLSSVLLQSLEDDSIPSQSLRIFMRSFFLVCCVTESSSIVYIFHLDSCRLKCLQSEQLPFFVSSISLIQAGTKIVISGGQTVTYEVSYEIKERTVQLNHMRKVDNALSGYLQAPVFYSSRGNFDKEISLFGEFVDLGFSSQATDKCQIYSRGRIDRFGSGPLIQVVTKRLLNERLSNLRPDHSRTSKIETRSSTEILKTLSGSLTTSPEDFYMLTIDCHDYVNLFSGIANSPKGHFRLDEPMLSASPIAPQYTAMQQEGGRLSDTRPLFMITCANGLFYIVCVQNGFMLPLRNPSHRLLDLAFESEQ